MALKKNPDFLFNLDTDEILMNNAKKILLDEINILHSNVDVFEFQFLEMWDKPNQYRYDGHISNIWKKKLIRMKNQPDNLHYDDMPYSGNMHCPGIPQNSFGLNNSVRSRVKILHYGYFDGWMTTYDQFMIIAPYLIMGPGLFTGLITLGVMVQVSNAFSRVHGGFALFLHNWTTITELRSIWKRLSEFERNLEIYRRESLA